ncbi:MlaD family protein [Mycolicibacterium obuense]|uniref:Mce related protein n=1 Tax=Mycolicibacterium obuense TaxID=1807 RepID=A0A0J6W1J2_9MYCO|nr:MlaD family protein [Mycolicibacterium obuense]KMO75588.1 mce related protein [Mycolicibacterium obuense]
MRARVWTAVAAAATALLVSSCAAVDVNDIPAPGMSYDDGYDVVMQFASALNLPDRAKVVLDGVTVGVVTGVALTRDDVDVTARIARGVVVPTDIHAVLQQATVLGDIYVALERPTPGAAPAPAVHAGGTIPLAQTTSPPQLEDTIASLANFVSSGSIQRAQNSIIRLNRVMPSSDEVRRLTTRVETDLSALSTNLDQVDQLLDGASTTAAVVNSHIPQLQYWFSPTGQRGFEHMIGVANYIGTILPGIGSITLGGYWLVPFLNSLADSTGALQQSKIATETEIPKYRQLFTDFFLPVDKYPAINITSIIGPDGRELSGNVGDVLRILGAAQ